MRVHKNIIKADDTIHAIAFRNHGEGDEDGMSTDWNKYSTPEETRNRAYKTKPSWEGGVVQMVVGDVRTIPDQIVQHDPLIDNPAHTNVKGRKDVRERYKFMQIWTWAIRYAE